MFLKAVYDHCIVMGIIPDSGSQRNPHGYQDRQAVVMKHAESLSNRRMALVRSACRSNPEYRAETAERLWVRVNGGPP